MILSIVHILRLICIWILRLLRKYLWAQLFDFVAIVLRTSTFFKLSLNKIKLYKNLQIDY